jgi:outer membrane protein assembly factor BamB
MLRVYKLDAKGRNIPRSMYGPDPEGSYGLGSPPPSPWRSALNRLEGPVVTAMYNRIDREVAQGQIGENETAYVGYLMEMVGFILNNPHYSRVRPDVTVPDRVKFIKLLGKMGSRETIPFLITIFNLDTEPSIKAACCEAVGTIGVDPTGEAIRYFRFYISPDNANRDPQTLISAAVAIAALSRFSGPPLSDAGISLLRAMGHMDFPPAVKRRAQAELDALYREGFNDNTRR